MYAKIFASLYNGTLRGKSHAILVFTNLLAHADIDGCVDMHWRAIADEVGLTADETKAALEFLGSPDPDSRSPEREGRRIIPLEEHRNWGWRIVNHAKYRSIRNDEDRRRQNREAQARRRTLLGGDPEPENILTPEPEGAPAATACPRINPDDQFLASAWSTRLIASGAKLGAKNWRAWKGVLDRAFGGDVEKCAKAVERLPADKRWPDQVEASVGKSPKAPSKYEKTSHANKT